MNSRRRLQSLDVRPLYMQAAHALREFLVDGAFGPGDRLPSEDALAAQLQVSRSTVREAVTSLEREGLIERRHGVGTFVGNLSRGPFMVGLEQLAPLASLARVAGLEIRTVEQRVQVEEAPPSLLGELKLEPGAKLVHIQSVSAVEGTRIAFFDVFLTPDVINAEACRRSGLSALEYLVQEGQRLPAYTKTHIRAVGAEPDVAERLGLPTAAPVLHLLETYCSDADLAVGQASNYLVTDRFDFFMVRRVAPNP